MKTAAVLVAMGFVVLRSVAQQPVAIPDRQIITSEEIRAAGAQRPIDLIRLADGWTATLRDGWHGDVVAGAFSLSEDSGWEVWIDGHRVSTAVLGTQDVNLIPIGLGEIDHVEVFRSPQVIDGLSTPAGLLHIHTRRNAESELNVTASAWMANESGDPGPLRYLGENAPNVDHLGPDYTGSVEWRSSRFDIGVGAVTRTLYPTDAAIRDRHIAISSEYPEVKLYGGAVHVRPHSGGIPHLAFHSSRLLDYFFAKPFGREIPVTTSRTFAGARGSFERDGREVGYRAAYTAISLGERPNPHELSIGWREDRISGVLEMNFEAGMVDGLAGVSAEERRIRSAVNLDDPTLHIAGAFVRAQPVGETRLNPVVDFGVRWGGSEQFDLSARLSLECRVGARHTCFATFAAFERHPSNVHALWFWTQRGYSLLDRLDVDHAVDVPMVSSRTFSIDARWRTAILQDWTATIGILARSFGRVLLPERHFEYHSDSRTFSGPVRLTGHHSGSITGIEGELEARFHERMQQRLYVRLLARLARDEAVRAALRRQPMAEATWRLIVSASPTFTIRPRVSVRSSTRWAEYEPAGAHQDIPYDSVVPASWTVDTAIVKQFWNGRIDLTMEIRNLLNQTYRHHPIGAAYDLTLSLQLLLRLDA